MATVLLLNGICRTPNQTGKCRSRPFLRWVQAQGRNLDTPGIPKNASDPVGIPLKRDPQAPGYKPSLLKEALNQAEQPPLDLKIITRDVNARPPSYLRQTATTEYSIQRRNTP